MIELNDKNYQTYIYNMNHNAFLVFESTMCSACQTLDSFLPSLEKYIEENELDIEICKINVNRSPKLAKKYEIQSVPFTCFVDKKNKKIKYPEIGVRDYGSYISMFDKISGRTFISKLINFLKSYKD